MATKKAVAFWLVPARPERDLFEDVIRILSRSLRAPEFDPHVTIFTSTMRPAEAARLLRRIRSQPIELKIDRLGYSAKFTKTLFVRFCGHGRLKALVGKFTESTGRRITCPADPHLSLCYKKVSASVKRELASAIKLPLRTVRFDVVRAVYCPSPTTTPSHVKAWRVLGTRRLKT